MAARRRAELSKYTSASFMVELRDHVAVNRAHNVTVANLNIGKEKQYKDKIESCHREMQKLGVVIA